jgi:hypothetical protein
VSLSDPRLRRAALLVSGAALVHQLRFALAPVQGGEGPGHAYLHAVLPAIAVLVALALVGFLARLVAPRREAAVPRSLAAEGLGCALVLLCAFVLQEGAESLLSAHGPIFASGGWLAGPLALVVGLGVAWLARGARAAAATGVRVVAGVRVAPPAGTTLVFAPLAARRPASAPLRHLAARPPPGSLVHQHQ